MDAFNKLRDEITERITRASTPEEIVELSKQVDELTSDYQKRINEVVAETKDRWKNRVESSKGDSVWPLSLRLKRVRPTWPPTAS